MCRKKFIDLKGSIVAGCAHHQSYSYHYFTGWMRTLSIIIFSNMAFLLRGCIVFGRCHRDLMVDERSRPGYTCTLKAHAMYKFLRSIFDVHVSIRTYLNDVILKLNHSFSTL